MQTPILKGRGDKFPLRWCFCNNNFLLGKYLICIKSLSIFHCQLIINPLNPPRFAYTPPTMHYIHPIWTRPFKNQSYSIAYKSEAKGFGIRYFVKTRHHFINKKLARWMKGAFFEFTDIENYFYKEKSQY